MGSRCLLVILVSGNMRLPVPPARTTPFIGAPGTVENAFKLQYTFSQMLVTELASALDWSQPATPSLPDERPCVSLSQGPCATGDLIARAFYLPPVKDVDTDVSNPRSAPIPPPELRHGASLPGTGTIPARRAN